MATDAGGTRPLTQLVAGNGQSSVSYQLPAGLFQYIQSVVATVDTSASGDVSPLLTIRDDANLVVADKQQGDTLDAGGSGRATWALRLTDESSAASHGLTVKSAAYSGSNVSIAAGVTGTILWDSFDAGDDLLDISTPGAPTVRTAGFYIVTSLVQCRTGGISFRQAFSFTSAGPGSAGASLTGDIGGLGATGYVTVTIAAKLAAGDALSSTVLNQGGFTANFFELQGSVAKLT